jgi:transcriptional regulator with XRE-family HTH domain
MAWSREGWAGLRGCATARPSSLRRTFADNVQARRNELGLSQEELADRAQVHRTFIGHVERAETNVSIDNIDRISAALEIPASELFRRTDAPGRYCGP